MIGDTLLRNRIIKRRTVPVIVYPRESFLRYKALANQAVEDQDHALRQIDRLDFVRDRPEL